MTMPLKFKLRYECFAFLFQKHHIHLFVAYHKFSIACRSIKPPFYIDIGDLAVQHSLKIYDLSNAASLKAAVSTRIALFMFLLSIYMLFYLKKRFEKMEHPTLEVLPRRTLMPILIRQRHTIFALVPFKNGT